MLVEKGYTVQRGTFEFWVAEQCANVTSCFANNPSSPYGLTYLPKGPSENISTYPLWGETLNTEVDGVNMSSSYRLNADETVLTLGQTPPRCLYYSFLPYVFDRYYPFGWTSSASRGKKCPNVTDPRGGRCTIFGSLGNPINMLNINSSKENGQSFNSEFAYFIGGNMDEVTKIQTMSVEAGIPNYVHNTFGLSSERVNLGLTPISDGFVQLFRFMFAENREQFADYMENPSKFITILRITPPPGGSGGISFPPAVFKKRVSTPEAVPTEGISHQDLENALNDILPSGILKEYQTSFPFVANFS